MDSEQVLKDFKKLKEDYDWEEGHETADNILSEFVRSLGYNEISEIYDSLGKWYA